jgi:eukaryotic-like serine/threonine-protein kinase
MRPADPTDCNRCPVKDSPENAWREIGDYLDQMIELQGEARHAWLEELGTRDPALAARIRPHLEDLEALEQSNFLGSALPSMMSLVTEAGQRFGSYTLDRPIGYGGMGTVWLAHRSDGRFEGDVAIKLLNAALIGHDGEERFRREGYLVGKLEHPNIARLLDAGMSEGRQPFLVLEYVNGVPITEYCDRTGLDIRARLELFLDVLAAVAHAHSHLMVHRDLKPANILVTHQGIAKLLDFGIAKLTHGDATWEREITRLGQTPLTPAYAAPEQIRNGDISTATDVYSLGVLLYELLTGTLPYKSRRETRAGLEEEILSALPTPPSRIQFSSVTAEQRHTTPKKLRKILQGDLDAIISTALKKQPDARYTTADGFAGDIKRYLGCEPILARRERSWYRVGKFLIRHKWPVLGASTSLLALLVGSGIALWQATVAQEQARRAQEINNFIASVFEEADPNGTGTGNTRAVDLLVHARARVEQELSGRRALQQELLCIVASSLYGLGENTEAEKTFERVTQLAGGFSPAALARLPGACLNSYADLETVIGEYSSAKAILEVLDTATRLKPQDLLVANTLVTRATLDLNLEKVPQALEESRRAYEMIRELGRPGSRESLNAALTLARIEYHADEDAAAIETATRALQDHASNPKEAERTRGIALLLRSVRVRALSELGRTEEAAHEYQTLMPELASAFGTNSHQYGVDLYEYSVLEQRRGDLLHSLELGEQSLAATRAAGSSGRNIAPIVLTLAVTAVESRRPDDALRWALEAQKLHRDAVGTSNSLHFRYDALVAFARGALGDPGEGISQLAAIIEQQREQDKHFLGRSLWLLGKLELRSDRFDDAVLALREAESTYKGYGKASLRYLPAVRADLGMALLRLGDLDCATSAFQAAISGDGQPRTPTPALADAHLGLARVALARRDPRTALTQATLADEIWRNFDGANPARHDVTSTLESIRRAAAAKVSHHIGIVTGSLQALRY